MLVAHFLFIFIFVVRNAYAWDSYFRRKTFSNDWILWFSFLLNFVFLRRARGKSDARSLANIEWDNVNVWMANAMTNEISANEAVSMIQCATHKRRSPQWTMCCAPLHISSCLSIAENDNFRFMFLSRSIDGVDRPDKQRRYGRNRCEEYYEIFHSFLIDFCWICLLSFVCVTWMMEKLCCFSINRGNDFSFLLFRLDRFIAQALMWIVN